MEIGDRWFRLLGVLQRGTLASDKPPRGLIKAAAVLEIIGLFCGGFIGAIIGILVWLRMQDPTIEAFYEP